MDEDGCDSSRICKTCPDIPLGNMVLSVFYLDCFQLELFEMVDFCSVCMDLSLNLIDSI